MARVRTVLLLSLIGLGLGLPRDARSGDSLQAAVPLTTSYPPADSLSLRFDLGSSGSSRSFSPSPPGLEVSLASPSWLLSEPRTVQLSPFASTLYSADRGAYMGLAVGYLGNLLGLWPETTVWYLMGAGAAMGAGWGAAAGPVTIQVRPGFDEQP